MTLNQAAERERDFAQLQARCLILEERKANALERVAAGEAEAQVLRRELLEARSLLEKAGLEARKAALEASRVTPQPKEAASDAAGNAYLGTEEAAAVMHDQVAVLLHLQEVHKAHLAELTCRFEQVTKEASFNRERVTSVAATAKDMQTTLTISSTTCQSMNSFVGRIWNPKAPRRPGPRQPRTPSTPNTPGKR